MRCLLMREIVFEVFEEDDGGYVATAQGESIVTEADTIDELRDNVREAVQCHFEGRMEIPTAIDLNFSQY